MPVSPLRLIFAGTPDFAALHLKALIDSEHQLLAVYTQPDRPAGRGRELQASPVKLAAESAGIPVYQPASLKNTDVQATLAGLQADLMVVVAYGLILPQPVLEATTYGCVNVHASLLPRWRGAAPIQRAIEAGDTTTGITIMQMDAGLDTGAMLATASCPVGRHTSATLHAELATLGPPLLLETLDHLAEYRSRAQVQDDSAACYAHKIDKREGLVDWHCSAEVIERRIRAFDPFPGCYSFLGSTRVKLWQASAMRGPTDALTPGSIVTATDAGIVVACGRGLLSITQLQLPGGKRLDAREVLRGHNIQFAARGVFHASPDTAG